MGWICFFKKNILGAILFNLFKKQYDAGYRDGVLKGIRVAEEILTKKDSNDLTPRMALAILIILLKRDIKKED